MKSIIKNGLILVGLTLIAQVVAVSAVAASPLDTISDAFIEGDHYANFRYRYEYVDQTGLAEKAKASTLRSRVGIKTKNMWGFSIHAEVEDVTTVGAESFNDTLNGKTDHPVVADVESTEINQANISYHDLPDTVVKYGRQVINMNNQRMVGEVGWRQNNQTFDGVSLNNSSINHVDIMYGYFNNVNRIFGDDSSVGELDSETHMANINWDICDWLDLTAYGIWLDSKELTSLSTDTYGGSLTGTHDFNENTSIGYRAEYARQTDAQDNTSDYEADYMHFQLAPSFHGFTIKAGYELLGSDDGAASFITPLATLHKFNGWADKFLTTPAAGLEDVYVGLGYTASGMGDWIDGTKLAVIWHDFSSDEGSTDYGTEIDVDLTRKFADHYMFGVRYANYDADDFATDTEKLIFSLGANFS